MENSTHISRRCFWQLPYEGSSGKISGVVIITDQSPLDSQTVTDESLKPSSREAESRWVKLEIDRAMLSFDSSL